VICLLLSAHARHLYTHHDQFHDAPEQADSWLLEGPLSSSVAPPSSHNEAISQRSVRLDQVPEHFDAAPLCVPARNRQGLWQ
jgi:hypothetical protein